MLMFVSCFFFFSGVHDRGQQITSTMADARGSKPNDDGLDPCDDAATHHEEQLGKMEDKRHGFCSQGRNGHLQNEKPDGGLL
jgi:hypothetical protein